MDHSEAKRKKPGKEAVFTSELGENPTDISTGSVLALIPLFSTSVSDSELSSMVSPPN